MKRRRSLSFLKLVFLLKICEYTAAAANPSIYTTSELSSSAQQQFQSRSPIDLRPRLSASQQTQILSDVQQHQPNFNSQDQPSQYYSDQPSTGSSTAFPSLARYKVDRKKQQQQLQQQLSLLQQQIQQQQERINQQLNQSFQPTIRTSYQTTTKTPIQYNAYVTSNNYQQVPTNQNYRDGSTDTYLSDDQNLQLQEYYEKQRELEILQRQREELLLEQQELRRQQELLRLQKLHQLTSTVLPSTSVTTAPSSSTSPALLLPSPTSRRITPAESDLFLRAIATHQKKFTTTPKPTGHVGKSRRERIEDSHSSEDVSKDLLTLIETQQNQPVSSGKSKPQVKLIYQPEKPSTRSRSSSNSAASERDLLLKQLKIALAQSNGDEHHRNVTTRDLVLPNGKKLQVIHAPNGLSSLPELMNHLSTTTPKPLKSIFEELTKGVVPPGADYEVIRQKDDGKLEEVAKPSIQGHTKKVTFVVLEEQPDGSYKVQGVKGNAEKETGTDVESIVERIKKGEIKLPPPSTRNLSTERPRYAQSAESSEIRESMLPTTFRPTVSPTRGPYVSVSPNSVSSTDKYVTSASSVSGHVYNNLVTLGTTPKSTGHVTLKYPTSSGKKGYSSTTLNNQYRERETAATTPSYKQTSNPSYTQTANPYVHFNARPVTSPVPRAVPSKSRGNAITEGSYEKTTSSTPTAAETLSNLLRKEGLFAMSKYLRESGLDNVLNETGPYTIFVPTDKAFRTLLVQLGGPEKAEQKFRDNPRLLSGLLLHHVVPGAFRIESLQDEMTGVSLAGTQLRVNVYSMHDHEWNDIKVTTINGARVAPNKRDVEIPQGIAHAIDRVMFPLPVGDLMQTMQADRERRFSTFLKLLHVSGLDDTLSAGLKQFTVFAPTDTAFAEAATRNGGPLWNETDGPEAAKEIALRHIIPTTLYTAGMRYFHQKETLRPSAPLQIQKTGGRIRVNDAHMITFNVPATNGVLHAVDAVM